MSGKRRTIQREIILCLAFVFLVSLADQASKIYTENIMRQGTGIPVIRNFLHITPVHNTGAAFGIFAKFPHFFIILAVSAICLIVFFLIYKFSSLNFSEKTALCFILGGTFGNLFDRIRLGYVVDFIDFRVWPVFNVADSFITAGAVILGWCFLKDFIRQRAK